MNNQAERRALIQIVMKRFSLSLRKAKTLVTLAEARAIQENMEPLATNSLLGWLNAGERHLRIEPYKGLVWHWTHHSNDAQVIKESLDNYILWLSELKMARQRKGSPVDHVLEKFKQLYTPIKHVRHGDGNGHSLLVEWMSGYDQEFYNLCVEALAATRLEGLTLQIWSTGFCGYIAIEINKPLKEGRKYILHRPLYVSTEDEAKEPDPADFGLQISGFLGLEKHS